MKIINGLQFQCSTTTCLPFSSINALNVRRSQMDCLSQNQCQPATFHQSTSNCHLFTNIENQYGNILSNMDTITMMVISDTPIPFG